MGEDARRITVRFFAAARAAADAESLVLTVGPNATVGTLVDELCGRNQQLAAVLARCSYLRDGVAVRDLASSLASAETVDVLPPFAGG